MKVQGPLLKFSQFNIFLQLTFHLSEVTNVSNKQSPFKTALGLALKPLLPKEILNQVFTLQWKSIITRVCNKVKICHYNATSL